MQWQVILTDDAAYDLERIYATVYRQDDIPGQADIVLDQLTQALQSLTHHPEFGVPPEELLTLGIREYLEIKSQVYRIIYRVASKAVYVMLIADERGDMQSLLQRRLL